MTTAQEYWCPACLLYWDHDGLQAVSSESPWKAEREKCPSCQLVTDKITRANAPRSLAV